MADTILITASLRIDRPADEVRAQYRDIDHHIRNNVHPSIHYGWEPAPPGQRKIRTTFRILGVPQFDVSLLEDAEDGSFVIRYLEGTNAGMVLVHQFVPIGEASTDVRLSATAPSTLGRKLLGPLFVVGARQVMKKALFEDKRDLEKGEFQAGIAAGNVEHALKAVRVLDDEVPAVKRAILEAACLVAVADGIIDPAERDVIRRLARVLNCEEQLAWAETRLEDLAELATTDRLSSEVERVGAALGAAHVAEQGLTAAAVVGLSSEGLSIGELALLRRMALAADFDEQDLGPLVERLDGALMRVE